MSGNEGFRGRETSSFAGPVNRTSHFRATWSYHVACLEGTTHLGLRREHPDDVADGVGGGAERFLLRVVQLDLVDLPDPGGAELHRDAHVEAVDAVLALEVRGAREDALLVEHDRVDHLRG